MVNKLTKGRKKPVRQGFGPMSGTPKIHKQPPKPKTSMKQGVKKQNHWYGWQGADPKDYKPKLELEQKPQNLPRATKTNGKVIELPNYSIDRIITLPDGSKVRLSDFTRKKRTY